MASPNHLTLEQKYAFVQLLASQASSMAEACRALRIVGEAFVRQNVGLRPWRRERWRACFYGWLIGEIHTADWGAMRPAMYRRRKTPKVSTMS